MLINSKDVLTPNDQSHFVKQWRLDIEYTEREKSTNNPNLLMSIHFGAWSSVCVCETNYFTEPRRWRWTCKFIARLPAFVADEIIPSEFDCVSHWCWHLWDSPLQDLLRVIFSQCSFRRWAAEHPRGIIRSDGAGISSIPLLSSQAMKVMMQGRQLCWNVDFGFEKLDTT